MTGEWEEKKGQKQTDRWSGKVMQLKRGGIPQASSVRYRRSSTRRSPDDFSTAVGLLRDATSLLAKKKGQPASDRPVSFRDFRSTLFYIYISQARTV